MLPIDTDAFGRVAKWDQVPINVLEAGVQASLTESGFPGAVLPVYGGRGATHWLAVASSQAEWRVLQPLLLAHVGPTVTDFTGIGRPLSLDVPVEAEARRAGAVCGAMLIPGPDCGQFAVRALTRLLRALRERPPETSRGREATSKLLGQLDLCLLVGDRQGAEALLATLIGEFRVDSLNQHFLEVRVRTQFRDWATLTTRPWFEMLCLTRKPTSIAADMLSALWHAHLGQIPQDLETQLEAYRRRVRPLAVALLPDAEGYDLEGVRQIYELELLEAHPSSVSQGARFEKGNRIRAHALENIGSSAQGSRGQSDALALKTPLRPANWVEWLGSLADPAFEAYAKLASEGASQWPIPAHQTTLWAERLSTLAIDTALDGGLGADRLFECLPQLIRTFRSDPEYPRPACGAVYGAFLQVLGLQEYKGVHERNAALELLDGLIQLGPCAEAYRRALTDFRGLVGPGAGTATAYWLVDVAGALLGAPASDEVARLDMLNRVLASLQSIRAALRPAQRAAYNVVAGVAGWEPLPVPEAAANGVSTFPARQTIAVYTLTESAARQAMKALLDVQPSMVISLAHDKVASPRLVRLARDADLFVFASSSATHAASDCIMANRGDRPVAYAVGRGFSSIVRAVEDHYGRPAEG